MIRSLKSIVCVCANNAYCVFIQSLRLCVWWWFAYSFLFLFVCVCTWKSFFARSSLAIVILYDIFGYYYCVCVFFCFYHIQHNKCWTIKTFKNPHIPHSMQSAYEKCLAASQKQRHDRKYKWQGHHCRNAAFFYRRFFMNIIFILLFSMHQSHNIQ